MASFRAIFLPSLIQLVECVAEFWRDHDIYSVRRRNTSLQKRTILTRGYLLQVDADEWRDALGARAAIIGPGN